MAYASDFQVYGNTAASGSACTVTLSNIPTAGHLLLLAIGNSASTSGPSSITDSASGTWGIIGSWYSGVVAGQSCGLYAKIAVGTETSVTVGAETGCKWYTNCSAWSGGPPTLTNILDQSGSNGDNTAVQTTNVTGLPALATTNPGDLIFSIVMPNGNITTPTGWTNATLLYANNSMATTGYQIETTTGTYSPYYAWSSVARKFQQVTYALFPASPPPALYLSNQAVNRAGNY